MELDELIRDAPPAADQVVEGVLVVRAGERWARVDGQPALWGPLVGAEHLSTGDELVFAQVQDGTPFVVYPAAATGGEPGPEGPEGPIGPTGPQGPQGVKGDTGATGAQGDQGPAGATGSQGPQGNPGVQGPQGVPGAAGEKWFTQAGAPAGATGAVGDWALDSTNGDYYEKTGASSWTLRGSLRGAQGTTGAQGIQGPQGVKGDTGAQGIQGPQGATGSTGSAGTPGTVWRVGSSNPTGATPGVVGDFYLNTTSGFIFEKIDPTTWASRGNIMGPQGPAGTAGTAGTPGAAGSVWRSGSGAPAGALGVVGDWYLNDANGDVYEKTGASAWTLRDNLTGPQGIQGIPGTVGTGPAGGDLYGSYPNPSVLRSEQLKFLDSRAVATVPNDYNGGKATFNFKERSAIGLPAGTGLYCGLWGWRAYADSTGGKSHEIAYTDEGVTYYRNGATTTWGAWSVYGGAVGPAGGDLGGTYPNPTVVKATGPSFQFPSGFASYTAEGVWDANARPAFVQTPAAGSRLLFGYADAGLGQYYPALGFKLNAGSGLDAALGLIQVRYGAESFNRFDLLADGKLQWGAGATLPDTNLYRVAANVLKTDDTLVQAGSFVSALPGSPVDGQEVYYRNSQGSMWHFRYNAGSASAYKWEYLGGSAMTHENEPELATSTAGSFITLDSGNPQLIVPLLGDYFVTVGSKMGNAAGGNVMHHGVKFGAAATVDADSIQSTSGGAQHRISSSRRFRRAAIAAGTTLISQYKTGGGTGVWAQRFLEIEPIRVA